MHYIYTSLYREYRSAVSVCQSYSRSAEQGKSIFPCPRCLRLRIWPCATDSAVPSRVSLFILHTQAESGAYSRNSSRFPRQRPFIYTANRHRVTPSRVYQVTHQRRINCEAMAYFSLPRVRLSLTTVQFFFVAVQYYWYLNKNLNASSEHPPVRGGMY